MQINAYNHKWELPINLKAVSNNMLPFFSLNILLFIKQNLYILVLVQIYFDLFSK